MSISTKVTAASKKAEYGPEDFTPGAEKKRRTKVQGILIFTAVAILIFFGQVFSSESASASADGNVIKCGLGAVTVLGGSASAYTIPATGPVGITGAIAGVGTGGVMMSENCDFSEPPAPRPPMTPQEKECLSQYMLAERTSC